jgi:hypothetical protein
MESLAELEPKRKSPKKKPFSITRLAVEMYQPTTTKSAGTEETSNFFTPPAKCVSRSTSPEKTATKKKSPKARAPRKKSTEAGKESVKPKKPTAASKSKRAVFVKPKLLSPTQAVRKMQRQSLLFGTSSQLCKEDSPESLKQLQQALRESELCAPNEDSERSFASFRSSRNVSRSRGGLWHESAGKVELDSTLPDAQNEADGTRDTLVQRLTEYEFTSIDEYSPYAPNADEKDKSRETPLAAQYNDEWVSVDAFSPSAVLKEAQHTLPLTKFSSTTGGFVDDAGSQAQSSDTSDLPDAATLAVALNRTVVSPSVTTSRVALRALSTNTKKVINQDIDVSQKKATTKSVTSKELIAVERPEKARFTTEQGPLPEKKRRGRPRKTNNEEATATTLLEATPTKANPVDTAEEIWQHIDDIEDSEPNITPSPPRRRGRPPKDSASQLPELVTTEAVSKRVNTVMASASHQDWPAIQPILFKDITETIKATLPSTDIRKPSWAEKISMYDPIVVEDLTTWLNEDMGLRVRVKQREDELQGWMVQKWCEEKSVCCLWREGLWGGVRKKY